MLILKIQTIGEVAFPTHMKLEEGYRYDIPFDNLMLPYLPIQEMLREEGLIDDDVRIGFAHPDGYRGLALSAMGLLKRFTGCAAYMRDYFTNVRFLEEEGVRIRSLKAGKCYYAAVRVPADRVEELKERLNGRKHIGISEKGITGEVELELEEMGRGFLNPIKVSDGAEYVSLDYTALLVTPTCFYAPYEEGNKTHLYMPGALAKKLILQNVHDLTQEEKESLRCSNAYISRHQRRLLPVPACMSVVKLDKKQLRYRLAPGKDPNRVEQDVGLSDCYALDFESHTMEYTTPETEHIASAEGQIYDALTTGQTFCGTVYGSDSMIRKVLLFLEQEHPTFVGALREHGYGEVYLEAAEAREKEPPTEILARTFDVSCVSDTLLLNDDGMPSCKAADLLREIEYRLGCEGKLAVEGRYTNIYRDYNRNPGWGADGPVVRCLAKGSVLRIRTVDGEPVDIFPLRHCFVGERTEDGYGELIAYPARGQYYRLAENVAPTRYESHYPIPMRGIGIGASFTKSVLRAALKSRVAALAVADRMGYDQTTPPKTEVPLDLLLALKEQYEPTVTENKMIRWYLDAWRGESK